MISHKNNFSAGEWSPFLEARTELPGHSNASRRLENALPIPLGPARGRPGMEFIAEAKYPDKPARVIDFNFSTTTNYMVELGERYARFFSNGRRASTGRAFDLGAGEQQLVWRHNELSGNARIEAQLVHLEALASAGAKWVRLALQYNSGSKAMFLAHIRRCNDRGIKVLIVLETNIDAYYPAGTAKRLGSSPAGNPQWDCYRHADLDLDLAEAELTTFLKDCVEAGVQIHAIEFFNEANWNVYVGDLALVPGGKFIDNDTALDDSDLVTYATGVSKVGQLMARMRKVSDSLCPWPLELLTPSLVNFITPFSVGWFEGTNGCMVRPETVLSLWKGTHPLQSVDYLSYADGVAFHLYPNSTDASQSTAAGEILGDMGAMLTAFPEIGPELPLWITEWSYAREDFADENARLAQLDAFLDALGEFSRNTARVKMASYFAFSKEASSKFYIWDEATGLEPTAAIFVNQLNGDRLPLEVESPFLAADVQDVQFDQAKDRIFFASPNHAPQMLTRYADDDWRWEPFPLASHPFGDPNDNRTHTLTPNGRSGSGVIVTANEATFTAAMVGSRLELSQRRANNDISLPLNAAASSAQLRPEGTIHFRTTGTWAGTVLLEQSYDNGTSWELLSSFTSNKDANHDATVTLDEDCLVRVRMSEFLSATESPVPYAYVEAIDPYHTGTALITDFISETQVLVSVETAFYKENEATPYWRLAAWSGEQGWPQALAFHEGRLFFAGTAKGPTSYWGSASGNFFDFAGGINDDNSVAATIATGRGDRIQSLTDYRGKLFALTSAEEWTIGPASGDRITPSNLNHRRQTTYGASRMRPLIAGDSLLFAQQLGRNLRSLVYDLQSDSYSATDISGAGEHLLAEGIVAAAYGRQPENVAWFITTSGKLIGLTKDASASVMAWHRHTTQGKVISVASHPSAANEETWFVIQRQVQGVTRTFIERFHPDTDREARLGNRAACLFVDAGSFAKPIHGAVRNLGHLEGLTLRGTADGATLPRLTVTAGRIDLPTWAQDASVITLGLSFAPKVQTFPLQMLTKTGSTFGLIVTAAVLKAYVTKTGALFYTAGDPDQDESAYFEAPLRAPANPTEKAPPLLEGFQDLTLDGGHETLATVTVAQFAPQPFFLLDLAIEWQPVEPL